MKIFISWSGQRSRAVAAALNDWLRRVIQAVRPFYSPEIDKGAKWSSEIDQALEGTAFGIICLTKDNLRSEWIHYEAGALSKTPDAMIWTFLLDLTPGEVGQPLGKYQHTVAQKEDVRSLVQTINSRLADPLPDGVLFDSFEQNWFRLDEALEAARAMTVQQKESSTAGDAVSERDSRVMFSEILEILRAQERRVPAPPSVKLDVGRRSRVSPVENFFVHVARIEWVETIESAMKFTTSLKEIVPNPVRIDYNQSGPLSPLLIDVAFRRPAKLDEVEDWFTASAIRAGVEAPEWAIDPDR